jgi:hypothetical protein
LGPLVDLGISQQPPLCRAAYDEQQTELSRSLVQSGDLSETETLLPNYIEELLTLDIIGLKGNGLSKRPPPLLHLLLRHSLLLAYTTTATKIAKDNNLIVNVVAEPEFVSIDQPTVTVWDTMQQPYGGKPTMGEYLQAVNLSIGDTAELNELRESYGYLQNRPTAVLERAMTESLDLATHRLDAWITSLATMRVEGQRGRRRRGIYLGGYGYVEDLAPDTPGIPVFPPEGEGGSPLYQTDAPAGFVHAPSLSQAMTAAVLRSAHLSHVGAAGNLLAVDLSSSRFRLAQWVLEGVRQGQPLGALLGYRFERALHENHPGLQLDQYISVFREIAPLVAKKQEQTDESVESIAASNVVDGLSLQRIYKEGNLSFDDLGLPTAGKEFDALTVELKALDAAADSVSDAVIAESVYQAVQGNMLRSGSSLDAVSAGEVPPPELEVARTPRSGVALIHRLIAFLSPAAEPAANWPLSDKQIRAAAEPALNAWAGKLLGDPHRVKVKVHYLDPTQVDILGEITVTLADINFSPLDVVYEAEAAPNQPGGDIDEAIRYYAALNSPAGVPEGAVVKLSHQRDGSYSESDLTLPEFSQLLNPIRNLLSQSRALEPNDLALPTDKTLSAIDVEDLQARSALAVAALTAATTALQNAVSEPPNPMLLRAALHDLLYFGLQNVVPSPATGNEESDDEVLLAQGTSVLKAAQQRLAKIAQLDASPPNEEDLPATRDYHVARIRQALGEAFRVLPLFVAANASELQQTFQDQAALLGDDSFAPSLWLSRAARVRAGAGRLDLAMRYGELVGATDALSLRVGQLPAGLGERWVGLQLDQHKQIQGGRVSLVAHNVTTFADDEALCGLLVDEWTEVIPNSSELTGVVFPHDSPGARAPHTVLLAVAPGSSNWTLSALEATVLETIELAKLRAVDIDTLVKLGQYLPALYFAFNVANDTVSTDFSYIAYPKEAKP